jgi:hypothetical protein
MSLQDQTEFHREFYRRWTVVHQHGDDRPVDMFFDMIEPELVGVLEIGGWDGTAAARVLPMHANILEWNNVEFCEEAVEGSVCWDTRYVAQSPAKWAWDCDNRGYSVLVMQHVIEHMKFDQFKALMDSATDIEWAIIQSPLDMGPHDWTGYPGCHILEVGWSDIETFMATRGFEVVKTWWDTIYSTAPENGRTYIFRRK